MPAPAGMNFAGFPFHERFMKPFEIFRPGTHVAMSGQSIAFADADLAAVAAGYDKALHHAPIVVGHPKQDAPAYGWVDALTVKDGRLVAKPAEIDTAFAELVREGKFKKVSASFYGPLSANNPTPGQYYLRHVGFLGAAAPAVKGLRAIEFAELGGSAEIEIEFSDANLSSLGWVMESVARLFRGLREKMIAAEGVDAADQVLREWEISEIARQAETLRSAESKDSLYSEKDDTMKTPETIAAEAAAAAAVQAELDRREQAIATREAAFAESERAARIAEDAAFVEAQVQAGRLPEGLKAQAVSLFGGLAEAAIEFADGGETKTLTPRDTLKSLLSSLPLPVVTGEIAKGAVVDFTDQQAVTAAIETEMKAAAEAGKPISAAEAGSRIKKGQ